MLIDGREVESGSIQEADVCIIGAGAAGITLALEFENANFSVALLESGGLESDPATQALYEGESVGRTHVPLASSRVRFFGGTTNHWGGWCRPLEEVDFEERSWVADSGWPIKRADLDPHYRRAHEIVGLGPFIYDAAGWQERGQGEPMQLDPQRFTTVMFQMRATRFGMAHRERVLNLPNVRTFIHSNVTELVSASPGNAITQVKVATLGGNSFTLRARIFILACGAIENARLLLASNRTHTRGIGNEHDLVGRYFMDHLQLVGGAEFVPVDSRFDPALYLQRNPGDLQVFGAVIPTVPTMQQNNLLGFGVTLTPRFPDYLDRSANSEAWESFRALARRLTGRPSDRPLSEHIWNVLRNLDQVANAAYGRLAASRLVQYYTVKIQGEQRPNPDSRVTLDTQRDALGNPRARLDWRLTDEDLSTLRNGLQLWAQEVGRAGVGRLRILDQVRNVPWQEAVIGSWHHMGTTRMSADARSGVVNPDCRVFSMRNLYIAGSSVFPTVGYANPTLTLTALAVRLAQHVKGVLQ